AARANEIIRHLQDFIAGHDSEKRADDIPEMLRNAVSLALLGIDPPIPAIEMRLSSVAPSAFFDRVQIEQVVFNLVRNAIEAMGDSERRVLTITTRLTADNMVEISSDENEKERRIQKMPDEMRADWKCRAEPRIERSRAK